MIIAYMVIYYAALYVTCVARLSHIIDDYYCPLSSSIIEGNNTREQGFIWYYWKAYMSIYNYIYLFLAPMYRYICLIYIKLPSSFRFSYFCLSYLFERIANAFPWVVCNPPAKRILLLPPHEMLMRWQLCQHHVLLMASSKRNHF